MIETDMSATTKIAIWKDLEDISTLKKSFRSKYFLKKNNI